MGRLTGVFHLMFVQVVPYQLPDHLRRGDVLLQAQLFKGFFLSGSMSIVSRAVFFSMRIPPEDDNQMIMACWVIGYPTRIF